MTESNADVTLTIRATMKRRWVPHFVGMLKLMEHFGRIGASRPVGIYADGDGDFQPRFECDPDVGPAKPVRDGQPDYFFDAG